MVSLNVNPLRTLRPAVVAGSFAATVLLAMSLLGALPATADDDAPPSGYPSWADVQSAKTSEASTAAAVERINSLLDGLGAQSAALGDRAVAAGADYARTKAALDAAATKEELLNAQVDRANADVDKLKKQAGVLAAQTYKSGGTGMGLFSGMEALSKDGGLAGLDLLHAVGEKTSALYNQAKASRAVAQSLTSQQSAARAERERLAAAAKTSLDSAVSARDAMAAQVAIEQKNSTLLTEQLASLKNTSAAVEQQFRQGQVAQATYVAAQAAKAAAAEKARQEAAAAAAAAAGSGGGNSGGGNSGGSGNGGGSGSTPVDPGDGYIPVEVLLPNIPGNSVNDPAGAKAYANARLSAYGWGADQYPCLVKLWTQESSWLTNATNPSSGAYGIAQALLPSKYGETGPDWLTNYRTQITWGLGYIANRYGSPCSAWDHEVAIGWY
ncbi:coiled-coil domain-containing protein [Pseudarthrobacter sp. P1]|uniref:coiled-coil domain-containing protein n=1 Tax=Pseudarthrobacter sp. P1 TaxID=3418418 RepID=UPI003CF19597